VVLYRFLTDLFAPLIALYLRARKARGREDADRFSERLGRPSLSRPRGRLLWCHAASVGETLTSWPLLEALRQRHPDWSILLTTGTVTSAGLVCERLRATPKGIIHQFAPVDRWPYVTRFLDHWRPDMALWIESELWPNMLAALKMRGTKAILLNGRMSERSYRRWRMAGGAAKSVLSAFVLGLAQTGAEKNRFAALGMSDVRAIGNLKFAASPLPYDDGALAQLRAAVGGRPVWLMASTHEGEEAIALRVHARLRRRWPSLLTVIAPRHPERGDAVAALIEESGVAFARRSRAQDMKKDTGVYLADTMGELGLFYRLCPLCCLAGSFAWGGHNPVEPALLGCAIVFGPRMDNFAVMADDMLAAGAARQVVDEDELADALLNFIAAPKDVAAMAATARDWALGKRVVLDQTLAVIEPFLMAPPHSAR